MTSPLPPYTVAVFKDHRGIERIAVKRIGGHWDVIAADEDWFDSDAELFEAWPEVEIRGEGIWPKKNG